MSTWLRVLLVTLGSVLGMAGCSAAELFTIGWLGHTLQGDIEGTGLVAFALLPFAAVIGIALGIWGTLRLTRKPRPVQSG